VSTSEPEDSVHSFAGHGALVTASGSGIGAETARQLARRGAGIVVQDLSGTRARAVADEIVASGGLAVAVKSDAADPDAIPVAVDLALERYGSLGILVNNAGLAHHGLLEQTTLDSWNRVLAVTLTSTFIGIREGIRAMKRNGGGAIVNIASVAGLGGEVGVGSYCAAKSAVINLTRVAAIEAGPHRVRVNCICPGIIRTATIGAILQDEAVSREQAVTSRHPLGRIGEAIDVASLVTYLVSGEAAFISGASFTVDGGLTATAGLPDAWGRPQV
jgi:meso-butanediol dehydrogenase/(S,S)-butanediol dehydrogenase/diacetyl reductase